MKDPKEKELAKFVEFLANRGLLKIEKEKYDYEKAMGTFAQKI
jgi:hypothetical protein